MHYAKYILKAPPVKVCIMYYGMVSTGILLKKQCIFSSKSTTIFKGKTVNFIYLKIKPNLEDSEILKSEKIKKYAVKYFSSSF